MTLKSLQYLMAAALALGAVACSSIDQTSLRSSSAIPEVARTDLLEMDYDPDKPVVALIVAPLYLRSNISKTVYGSKWSDTHTNHQSKNDNQNWNGRTTAGLTLGAVAKKESIGRVEGDTVTEPTQNDSAQVAMKAKANATKDEDINSRTHSQTDGRSTDTVKSSSTIERVDYANVESAEKITMQLVSALGGVKNFKLIDHRYAKHPTVGGARGPFIVQGVVTEYTEDVEGYSDKVNLFTLYKNSDVKRTGVVGLDIKVVDPTDGSIKLAFPVKTSFSSQEKSNSVGLLFDIARSKKFAQSALDQALRQALFETSKKLSDALL